MAKLDFQLTITPVFRVTILQKSF